MKTFLQYRQEKQGTHQIDEQLTKSQEIAADRMKDTGHSYYRERFLSHNPEALDAFKNHPDKKQWSTRVPVDLSEESGDPHPDVKSFLTERGYHSSREMYRQGLASKTVTTGSIEKGIPLRHKEVSVKIGKVLEEHKADDKLKSAYMNDPYRTGKSTKAFDMILTGHHHDVYGGSTGRGWTSCTDMTTKKVGTHHMQEEINSNTHHVYLLPRGGNVDTDAVARISFKEHTGIVSGHQTLLGEHTVYGSAPSGFKDAAHEFVGKLFKRKPDELYVKNQEVYHDGSSRIVAPDSGLSAEHLDKAWTHTKANSDPQMAATIMGHVNPDHKYKSVKLNNVAKGIKYISENAHDFSKAADFISTAQHLIPEHHRVHSNEHLQAAMDTAAKSFDVNNEDHITKLSRFGRFQSQIGNTFSSKVRSNIGAAHDVPSYMALHKLQTNGINVSGSNYKLPIAEKHSFGKDAMGDIVRAHAESNTLNHDTVQKAYHSTIDLKGQKRKGNFYDKAVQLENDGVPGMSKVIESIADKVHNKTNYHREMSHEGQIASTYLHMKPATRERMAEAAGTSVKDIMSKGKDGVKHFKESAKMMRDLIKKAKENQTDE